MIAWSKLFGARNDPTASSIWVPLLLTRSRCRWRRSEMGPASPSAQGDAFCDRRDLSVEAALGLRRSACRLFAEVAHSIYSSRRRGGSFDARSASARVISPLRRDIPRPPSGSSLPVRHTRTGRSGARCRWRQIRWRRRRARIEHTSPAGTWDRSPVAVVRAIPAIPRQGVD